MDELQMIGTMLAKPDPATDVVERGRRQLLAGGGAPVRGRRIGWVTGGLSLTAAAAAAAVLVVSQTNAPTPTTHSPPVGAARQPGARQPGARQNGSTQALSGQQVLLSAATSAATQPDQEGTYWYVRDRFTGKNPHDSYTLEEWTRRDAQQWRREATAVPPFNGVQRERYSPIGFGVAHEALTLAQLRALPTDPAALTKWIKDSFAHPTSPGRPQVVDGRILPRAVAEPLPAKYVPGETALQLAKLLYQVPAPAAVRSAAFRALAASSNVRNLGPVAGGQKLRITFAVDAAKWEGHPPAGVEHMDLVVNPDTARVLGWTDYTGTDRVEVAQWTDHLPR